VGKIASLRIKPRTARKIAQILKPGETLASIATWADTVKERMGKTDSIDNENKGRPEDGATNPAADAPAQAQMTLFETVTAPTMTTENSSPVDTEHVHQEGQEGKPAELRSDAKAGADDESPLTDAKVHDADVDAADDADVEDAGVRDAVVEDPQVTEVRVDAVAEPAGADNELRIPAIEESLGQRLRAAREARGMQCEEAAHAMRLPLATVQGRQVDARSRVSIGSLPPTHRRSESCPRRQEWPVLLQRPLGHSR